MAGTAAGGPGDGFQAIADQGQRTPGAQGACGWTRRSVGASTSLVGVHRFATMHLDTGVSHQTLSEATGHSRPSTTNTFCRRVDRRHHQAAAGRLEALMQDASALADAGGVAGAQGLRAQTCMSAEASHPR